MCCCQETDLLSGAKAESYTDCFLNRVRYTDSGWRQLFKCTECGTYWEMTWEDGQGGFDYGVLTLRKLGIDNLRSGWSDVLSPDSIPDRSDLMSFDDQSR